MSLPFRNVSSFPSIWPMVNIAGRFADDSTYRMQNSVARSNGLGARSMAIGLVALASMAI
jgi:hypothetical protein